MRTLPNLEVIFSTGAGIDQFDLSCVPPHVAVVRMTEHSIVEGIVEYVTQAVLTIHRDVFDYAALQREHVWREMPVRAASTRRVSMLGLGMLGTAVLKTLRTFGFDCAGWSRSPHQIEGVECHAGAESFDTSLARTDILMCLSPLTKDKRGIIGKHMFDTLPEGASFINVGRRQHVVQHDRLAALDSGRLCAAILDVTDPEPLAREHPLWTHPRVRLTPHIASAKRPENAVDVVLDNVRRHRAGLPMSGAIDRARGY
jgi:glyoxylate/hydroxypyruvate reductase